MSSTIMIRDEELSGKTIHEFSLELPAEEITVRELIRSRVYQEVKDHNAKQNQLHFHGLVQPSAAERTLNGFRLKQPKQIDWRHQFEAALDAFESRQVLILVDDRQVDSLEDPIVVGSNTAVSFLKLTPLVGG